MARHPMQDPDAALDATACVQNMLRADQHAPHETQPGSTAPQPPPHRIRRSKGRPYGPDSIPGLCDYFTRSCPPLSWAGGLEIGNRQALVSVFSELRRDVGLTPQDCRALIDLYIRRLGSRRPQKPYVWDFKWQRYQLLAALRDTGTALTGEDYQSWTKPSAQDPSEDGDFTASWGPTR